MRQRLAAAQGAYYLISGVWPLLSMRTFEAVTGPKYEQWLVKTVGVLVAVIGLVLLRGARRPDPAGHVPFLGASSAAALAGVDNWYAGKGRISPIYLADAVLQLALLGAWLTVRRAR